MDGIDQRMGRHAAAASGRCKCVSVPGLPAAGERETGQSCSPSSPGSSRRCARCEDGDPTPEGRGTYHPPRATARFAVSAACAPQLPALMA